MTDPNGAAICLVCHGSHQEIPPLCQHFSTSTMDSMGILDVFLAGNSRNTIQLCQFTRYFTGLKKQFDPENNQFLSGNSVKNPDEWQGRTVELLKSSVGKTRTNHPKFHIFLQVVQLYSYLRIIHHSCWSYVPQLCDFVDGGHKPQLIQPRISPLNAIWEAPSCRDKS